MPVPHFNIKITQRSKGNSAVAGAAYQAGEKLFSEYDQKTKNYTCKKEVVYTEIMLPPNAPPEYADRATLWNSVEEIEKQWNSQLARRFVAALPREVPMELLPQMVKEYCEEQFVSKGMCCDFAIHDPDPPGHNPHCHFMLTMRAIDENGKWMPKSRKVYDLDENGERIKLPSGRWKSHKEDTVDWNEQYHAEEWRHGWEIVQNKYLELAGSPERIDMRSYERQGLDIIPTVHMGTAVSALERKGIATNIGNLNRDIKAANRMMNAIRSTIKSLRDWIADILEATKEVIAENEAEKKNASPNLAVLLRDYLNLRKAERSEWSRYGQQKGTTDDLKTISQATVYLQRHELFTLEDLDIALQGVSEKATAIREDMQKAANRMKAIIKSFISRAKETYKVPYETHPADRLRQCVFGGSSNTMDFLPLDRSGNRRFLPIMVHPENAEIHILEDEAASRAFIDMMWAEVMFIYQNFPVKLTLSKDMDKELKELQKQFMPEDTKAGLIQSFLDNFKGTQVCSKLIYAEALNHPFDEPKQWEIREINEIMNNSIEGWRPFSNPRSFAKYGRQRGWERIPPPDNEPSATGSNLTDGFRELTEEEARQMELPF